MGRHPHPGVAIPADDAPADLDLVRDQPARLRRGCRTARTGHQTRERRRGRRQRLVVPPDALRQAGLVMVLAGGVGLLSDVIPGSIGYRQLLSTVLDVATAALGAALFASRGSRLLQRAGTIGVPLVGLGLLAGNDLAGVQPVAVFGVWLVAVFVWVGLWLPRGSALALAPAAVAAYALPLLFGAPRTPHDLISTVLLVPVTVTLGEVVGANSTALRRAQDAQLRILDELSRAGGTDPLTHLGNRRIADMVVESLAAGDGVVMIDLDEFKKVNDTFGYPAGDQVLHDLGAFLQLHLREGDAAACLGGDEFVLVLSAAGNYVGEVTTPLLSRLRDTDPLTTLSIGVAVHKAGRRPRETYAAADRALYAAKQAGRDRAAFCPIEAPIRRISGASVTTGLDADGPLLVADEALGA